MKKTTVSTTMHMVNTLLMFIGLLLLFNTITMTEYLIHKNDQSGESFKDRTVKEWSVTDQAEFGDRLSVNQQVASFPKGLQTVSIDGFSPITVTDQLNCKLGVKTTALTVTEGATLGNTLRSDADGKATWGSEAELKDYNVNTVITNALQLTTTPGTDLFLRSDGMGNASWVIGPFNRRYPVVELVPSGSDLNVDIQDYPSGRLFVCDLGTGNNVNINYNGAKGDLPDGYIMGVVTRGTGNGLNLPGTWQFEFLCYRKTGNMATDFDLTQEQGRLFYPTFAGFPNNGVLGWWVRSQANPFTIMLPLIGNATGFRTIT